MNTIIINNKKIPKLGIGSWHIGDDPSKKYKEIEAIRYGLDYGLNLIDTAEMYGYGKSEEIVGQAIQGYNRENLYLVSKVLPSNANKKDMEESLDGSLKRMGLDYLDLYLLHWTSSTPLQETINEFERLKSKGKIKNWGVSNLDTPQIEKMLDLENGKNCLTSQILYNLGERGTEYSLRPLTDANNIFTMAYCPLAQNGLLQRDLLTNTVVQDIAEELKASPQQVLLLFIQYQDNIIPIPKTGNIDHMKDNCKTLEISLSQDQFNRLDKEFPAPDYKTRLAIK